MVDNEQIDELLKLAKKAHTMGRWEYFPRRKSAVRNHYLTLLNKEGESMYTWPGFVKTAFEEDARYIVVAANLAPFLANELLEARAEIKRLKNNDKDHL